MCNLGLGCDSGGFDFLWGVYEFGFGFDYVWYLDVCVCDVVLLLEVVGLVGCKRCGWE